MAEVIDFSGVKEASDKNYTRPGTIDVFTISKVEFGQSKNKGTLGMKLFMDRKQDGFNHTFYLTKAALGRVKFLYKVVTGNELAEDAKLTDEALTKLLEGKRLAFKVTGKVDETTGKGYADLSFGGFCATPDRIDFLAFTTEEEKLNEAALAAIERSRRQPDDSAGGGAEGGEAPAGGKKW